MHKFKLVVVLCALLVSVNSRGLSAQSSAENQWMPQLDRIGGEIAAKNYKSASRLLVPIVSDLMRKNPGRSLSTPNDIGEIPKDDLGVSNALRKLRIELNQGELSLALKTAFGLGMSLNYLDTAQPAQTRLRQERLATPETSSGRASIVTASALMLSTFRAGEFAEADRLARQILNDQTPVDSFSPGTSKFKHNANTILGLIALNNKNVAQAKQFLADSVTTLKPDRTISIGQPNLALADALLKLGEKEPVLAFLAACAKLDAWNQSKEKLNRYNQEILSGNRQTFAPDNFLMF